MTFNSIIVTIIGTVGESAIPREGRGDCGARFNADRREGTSY